MKHLRTLFILLILPLISINATVPAQEVVIKIASHCDHFEQCETGKSRLEKEFGLTKGIKSAKFDCTAMTVTVKYNPKRCNPDQIRQVISKAGYDADDVKADPKGQAKLDGCCQKK